MTNQEKVTMIRECHKLLNRAEEIFDVWMLLIKA